MKKIYLLSLFIALLFIPNKVSATIYRVGNVWGAQANYQTLQSFLASGAGKAATDEIWLGAGEHELNTAWEIISWQSKLYGGFAGTETTVNQRVKNSDVPWDFTNKTVIKLAATVATDARKSLLFNSMSGGYQPTLSLIDGITFDGTGCTASVLFLRAFTNTMTLRNCVIENGNMNTGNVLNGGTADCIAGGITVGCDDAAPTGSLNIEGCLIQNNKGRVGGIFARRLNSIANSVIRNNEAKTSTISPYAAGEGGGIYVVDDLTVFGCILQGNKSAGNGGAIFQNAVAIVANSVFYNNQKGSVINHVYANGKGLNFVNNIIDKEPAGAVANNNLVQADILPLFAETERWTPVVDFPGQDQGTSNGLQNIPATDLAGNPRIVHKIDIGPYEINAYTVTRTADATVTIDNVRSDQDGRYVFGAEYKIYFTIVSGSPIPNVEGSTDCSVVPEAGVTNGYILTVRIGGKTTVNLSSGTPRYITLVKDPSVMIQFASSFKDETHNGDYVVADGAVFSLRFTIPEGQKATVQAGGQTLVPVVTSDTIYEVITPPVTADITLNITAALAELPAPVRVTTESVDWASFLAQHDLYWTSFKTGYPDGYFSGAIMGNGLLGTDLYKESANIYRLNVGRTDVTEGRIQHPIPNYTTGSHLFDEARLPVGSFRIAPAGSISADTARLSLYNAVTRGIIKTSKGNIDYRTYVHAQKNYIVWESVSTDGEANYTWSFAPDQAISPRIKSGNQPVPVDYQNRPNPAVENNVTDGEYKLCIQPLLTGWVYVVAWKEVKDGNKRRVIATVAYESNRTAAISAAKETLAEAFTVESAALLNTHTGWWNNYYPSSFVSFDNVNKMESFYWAQVYKFACASREGKPMVDIMGPWPVVKTPWPSIWMNLNTQLTYSWLAAANRPELSKPLWLAFNNYKANLIDNAQHASTLHYSNGSTQSLDTRNDNEVIAMARSSHYILKTKLEPEAYVNNQYEVANMTWLLYYYWQYCVYNNKEEELKGEFFELLTYSINYYFHLRKKFDADGKYHLPVTASPEYSSGNIGADVNYDHSTVRWGLQTLIAVNDKYNLGAAKRAEWQDFLDNLAPYPTGTNGYKISASQEYATSHRHWSHLLQIYPYYLVNWDNPADRNIISTSVDWWQSKSANLQGYSYSGSSAMYSGMGDGQRAFEQLNKLIGNSTYIRPNTLYYESGNPVFETPMSAVSALHDMYLQSWGGKIRVFPAVPAQWKDASFISLRTEGAFLVSATRNHGKTVFIQVESEAGGLCRLQTGINLSQAVVRDLSGNPVPYSTVDLSTGLIEIDMQKGAIIQVLNRAGTIKYPEPVWQSVFNTMKFGVNNGPAPENWDWTLPWESETGIGTPGVDEIEDPVVAVRYFNLFGIPVSAPDVTGVYIKQKQHLSGKQTATKEIKLIR
jgi:hypothetical protein